MCQEQMAEDTLQFMVAGSGTWWGRRTHRYLGTRYTLTSILFNDSDQVRPPNNPFNYEFNPLLDGGWRRVLLILRPTDQPLKDQVSTLDLQRHLPSGPCNCHSGTFQLREPPSDLPSSWFTWFSAGCPIPALPGHVWQSPADARR